MFYPRKLIEALTRHIHKKEIVVLTGMRRTGKTTLYRMLFNSIKDSNKVFLDLENPIEQRIFEEKDYNNIWASFSAYKISNKRKAYIFLDEIQSCPQAVKAVKYLYDHYNIKFFLTGSSSFYLKNLFPESLSGRKASFELFPLDYQEFLLFKNYKKEFRQDFREKERRKNPVVFEKEKKLFEQYLEFGGFPQVVLAETKEDKNNHLNDIFKSYFEKDVRGLADFKDIRAVRELILLLLQRTGSKLDITKIASETGVSRETIYSYLSFLQGTYFIDLITPFTANRDREVSGAKKVYVCDNGFLTMFAKISSGQLLENLVFQNLKKYGKLHYYQRRTGGEIDFIIPDSKTAFEVKETGTPADYKKLSSLSRDLNLKQGYVITKNYHPDKGFIPASDI